LPGSNPCNEIAGPHRTDRIDRCKARESFEKLPARR
jgi:hypothetical protein